MVKKQGPGANTPATQEPTKAMELKKFQEQTVTRVLTQVNELDEKGGLHLPSDYSAANALKSAWLKLLVTKDSNEKPVLEVCSHESICNALLDMVVQGLNPMKKQCAFIAYKGQLSMQPEYHGNIALAKRYGDVKHVRANVIYQGDEFKYTIDQTTGLRIITKHEQDFENIDINKIKGAYATLITNDGTVYIELMNILQIRKAWEMGFGKGTTKAHKNFTDQMAIKTVINRACKLFISTSNDAGLVEGREYEDAVKEKKSETIKAIANQKNLNIDEATVVVEKLQEEVKPEQPIKSEESITPNESFEEQVTPPISEDEAYKSVLSEVNKRAGGDPPTTQSGKKDPPF